MTRCGRISESDSDRISQGGLRSRTPTNVRTDVQRIGSPYVTTFLSGDAHTKTATDWIPR